MKYLQIYKFVKRFFKFNIGFTYINVSFDIRYNSRLDATEMRAKDTRYDNFSLHWSFLQYITNYFSPVTRSVKVFPRAGGRRARFPTTGGRRSSGAFGIIRENQEVPTSTCLFREQRVLRSNDQAIWVTLDRVNKLLPWQFHYICHTYFPYLFCIMRCLPVHISS